MSLAEQLKAKKQSGLKRAEGDGGEAPKPKPAAGPPKLDLMGELKLRAMKKKQMEEAGGN